MNDKPARPIDKLLAELAQHSAAIDAAVVAKTLGSPPSNRPVIPCEKARYSSEAKARKASPLIMKRGANTSFFRSYFCPECKSWHLTSSKN
jgi:hypothetical protein